MLRLLADENFNGDIVRALLLRQPDLDIVRVQDVGLASGDDPDVLAWAAENKRIVLTHDRATMSDYAYERVAAEEGMAGVFILNDRFPVGRAIEEILLLVACTDHAEWSGRAVHVPLSGRTVPNQALQQTDKQGGRSSILQQRRRGREPYRNASRPPTWPHCRSRAR